MIKQIILENVFGKRMESVGDEAVALYNQFTRAKKEEGACSYC